MTVRTRIAPSPTGDPHVGTAYVALFNWAYARSLGGEFVLRIEDTDVARSTPESEAMILDALRWLGLDWDEGPDCGGPHGPYRQSERREIYREHAEQLVVDGHAFHCFCTPERLAELRSAQQSARETSRYDGRCLDIPKDDVARRIEAGEAHVIRMRVPEQGDCTFTDLLRGEVTIPYAQIDMQVLVKADGFPTYHLAVVVDDHRMGITHVLRGEEWINSVPKHVLLYQYFGWDMPVLCHLPLLRNPDSSKLSKRKNPTSVNYYRDMGYLPQALVNYLATMGYSLGDDREIFDTETLIEAFDISRVSLGGPIFDQQKLAWMNGQYVRALSADAFMDALQSWALNRDRLAQLVPLVQERTERFSDLGAQVDYLLGERVLPGAEAFAALGLEADTLRRVLHHTAAELDTLRRWEREALVSVCQDLAAYLELKLRDYLKPLFLAISGRAVSLPLFDSMVFLGPDITRVRVREAVQAVGVSKRQAKQLDKSLANFRAGRG